MQVRTLRNPSLDEFGRTLELLKPNIVYLQGQLLPNDEIGSIVWDGVDLSDAEVISELFNHVLPTTVRELPGFVVFYVVLLCECIVVYDCILNCCDDIYCG